MAQTWYFLRHAEKEKGDYFNPILRHQDEPLTANGRQQAQRLVSFFAGKDLARLYASAYLRARQTIQPLAEQRLLTPLIDPRLNEIDNGRLDGMPDQEIQQQYPEIWNAYTSRKADFRFPGGETGEEAQQRIASFLEESRLQDQPGDILVLTHEGLIRLLVCYVVGIPVYKRWTFQVDFCGITELTYQPGYAAWKLVRVNHVC